MEDKEIIALYFQRNADAIQSTSDKYGSKLTHQAERILGSREDAEECLNDTLLKAWNAIPPNRPRHLFAYLASICRNTALSRLNWEKAGKRNAVVVELTKEMEACIPDRLQQESVSAKELRELMESFLKDISEEKRNLFLRRYWYADSYKEIAERFGCSESSVRVSLYRIRNDLKQFLKKEGIHL